MLRPDSATALFQVFALDAATGHLEEAKSGFEKLVKQWPDFVEAHLQLAMVYARLHQTQDSERERRIVVELNDKARSKTMAGRSTVPCTPCFAASSTSRSLAGRQATSGVGASGVSSSATLSPVLPSTQQPLV